MTAGVVRPVGVDELNRAWAAAQAGEFRQAPGRSSRRRSDGQAWQPDGHAVPVIGCLGQCGASTFALALAGEAGAARVVECCSASASGLAGASTAELGVSANGWTRGRRGEVTLARTGRILPGPDSLPLPDPDPALTVLDVGWEVGAALESSGWLGEYLNTAALVVAVTTATVPGLRRAETALALLGAERVVVVVVGPERRRWPAHVSAELGHRLRVRERDGLLLPVPLDRRATSRAPGWAPPSAPLRRAAATVLRHLDAGNLTERNGSC